MAGILQPPIFNIHWPYFAKFGSIALIIAHEMMHAFDPKNVLQDETGSYHPLLSTNTSKGYATKANCFIKQYNKYEFNTANLKVSVETKYLKTIRTL